VSYWLAFNLIFGLVGSKRKNDLIFSDFLLHFSLFILEQYNTFKTFFLLVVCEVYLLAKLKSFVKFTIYFPSRLVKYK